MYKLFCCHSYMRNKVYAYASRTYLTKQGGRYINNRKGAIISDLGKVNSHN